MTLRAPDATSRALIAPAIEYTDLRKDIAYRDVEALCMEAVIYGLGAIVIPSALVKRAASCIGLDSGPGVGTVLSYPFGTQSPCVKAREGEIAVSDGAAQLDVVPHFGAVLAGRWGDLETELVEIRRATGAVPLKLVLETGRLSPSQIREACAVAANMGFEFVVNTVGFRLVSTDPSASGSANAQTIRALRDLSGEALEVKAAGAVHGLEAIADLMGAGAARVAVDAAFGVLRSFGWADTARRDL